MKRQYECKMKRNQSSSASFFLLCEHWPEGHLLASKRAHLSKRKKRWRTDSFSLAARSRIKNKRKNNDQMLLRKRSLIQFFLFLILTAAANTSLDWSAVTKLLLSFTCIFFMKEEEWPADHYVKRSFIFFSFALITFGHVFFFHFLCPKVWANMRKKMKLRAKRLEDASTSCSLSTVSCVCGRAVHQDALLSAQIASAITKKKRKN